MDRELMLTLVGKAIRVDRGGPESRVGILLAVEDDYFTLYTKDDGVVYYKMQHIKSVTLDSKGALDQDVEAPGNVDYYQGVDFKMVVSNFRHSWVKVNRGGPEAIQGILEGVEDEYVTIFSKEEVIHLAMFHIRNISGVSASDEDKKDHHPPHLRKPRGKK